MGCIASRIYRSRRVSPSDFTSTQKSNALSASSRIALIMVPQDFQKQLQDLTEINNFIEIPNSDFQAKEKMFKEYADLLENPHLNIVPQIRACSPMPVSSPLPTASDATHLTDDSAIKIIKVSVHHTRNESMEEIVIHEQQAGTQR